MSSNPPTENPPTENPPAGSPPAGAAATPTARWRSPAGWSLRARLIVTMITLLAFACLIVGATTELALHRFLYQKVDAQLTESGGPPPRGNVGRPPGGPTRGGPGGQDTLRAFLVDGMVDEAVVLQGYGEDAEPVAPSVVTILTSVPPGAKPATYDLGSPLGDYRLVAVQRRVPDRRGSLVTVTSITGLPLADQQSTLYEVATVAGGVSLLALLLAGWASAVIVRRTLLPLSRVAATATRVSELQLDHGEVDLVQRVPEPDTDPRTEVGQVGAALNRMLDHVGTALERRHASETQVRQFVADASHELRTPLAAIRGYAELSRRSRTPVPADIAHVLRRVESEATRMTTLVEDLLLLARLDAGRPLADDPVDLTALTVDAVSDAHATAPHHTWQLHLPDEPVTVTGDPARLHQVLANLLANARTHTPEGTTVTTRITTEDHHAILQITDTGPGIPPHLQPHIFERFARGDSSRSRAAGSTGLGLSIVHAVVTAHRGTVSVDSRPGRTVFTVRLPVTPNLADGASAAFPQPVGPPVRLGAGGLDSTA